MAMPEGKRAAVSPLRNDIWAKLAAIILPAAAAGLMALATHAWATGPAPFWAANGCAVVVAASLCRRSGALSAALGLSIALGCGVSLMAAQWMAGGWASGPIPALANGVEIAAALSAAEAWRKHDRNRIGTFVLLFAGLLGAATLSGLVMFAGGADALFWWPSHAAALMVIVPIGLAGLSREGLSQDMASSSASRTCNKRARMAELAILAAIAAGAAAILWLAPLPGVLLLFPLAFCASCALLPRGTALALAIITGIACIATLTGHGPIENAATLQLLCAALVASALPAGVLLGHMRGENARLRQCLDENARMLDTVDEGIFRIDNAGRWTMLNAGWERITGYDRTASLGRPVLDFLDALGGRAEREKFIRLVRGERGLITSLHTIRRPDGETRHVEVRMQGAFDERQRPIGLEGHIRDVTQTARYGHALEDAERRFATLADAAPVGIWRTNARGDTLFVNSAFKRMTGLSDGQWEGSHWITALHPDDFERVMADWKEILEAKAPFEAEWRWRRPDGEIVWVATTGAPQYDHDGRVKGYIGINIDISRQRNAEAQLADQSSRMQAMFDRMRLAGSVAADDLTDWDVIARQLRPTAAPSRRWSRPRKSEAA